MHIQSPGWGTIPWGLGTFGLLPNVQGPLVIFHSPANNQLEVLENTPIIVQFFDPTYDLDTASVIITVNGVAAYTGMSGFGPGYVGKVSYAAGVLTVQLRNATGFKFEEVVTASAYVADLTDDSIIDNWTFRIRPNPLCYTGVAPLQVETALQSPFTTFISLEFYRQLFLDNALSIQTRAIENRGNKAARVLYQTAFATELSTLQNIYGLRDKDALDTTVCEKQHILSIDKVITANSKTLQADLLSFQKLSGLDRAYSTAFNDYLDSSLYVYRVSLIANVLLYAAAFELAQV